MMKTAWSPHKRRHILLYVLPLCWFVLLTLVFIQLDKSEKEHAQIQAYACAKTLYTAFRDMRIWNAQFGGVLVEENAASPPNPWLTKDKRTARAADGRLLVRVNPAYMIRQLSEIVKDSNVLLRLPGLAPLNPINRPDSWERSQLLRFELGVAEGFTLEEGGGNERRFRFIAPLVADTSCLSCHITRSAGDVLGALSVSMPADSLLLPQESRRIRMGIVFLLTAFVGAAGIVWTIRKNERSINEIMLSEERYRLVSGLGDMAIFDCDLRCDTAFFPGNWRGMFGMVPDGEHFSRSGAFLENVHVEDRAVFRKFLKRLFSGGRSASADVRFIRRDGSYLWCNVRGSALCDALGKTVRVVGCLCDIDDEKREKQQLTRRAMFDDLTSIYNRATFEHLVHERLRRNAAACALLLLDVDHFKEVNDSRGHQFGDNVLREVARTISGIFGENVMAGRVGGDEFGIFLDEAADRKDLLGKVETFYRAIHSVSFEESDMCLGVSLGIAFYPEHGKEYESLFRHADEALYAAKNAGRDTFRVYEPCMEQGSVVTAWHQDEPAGNGESAESREALENTPRFPGKS